MFGASPSAYRAAHKPAPESQSGTHFDDVSSYHPPDYDDIPSVEVKELPPMRIVFLRHVGPYTQVGATWGRLMAWAGRRGLLGPGMKLIGIVHDDPDVTPPDKVRYDAAVTVNRPVQPEGEFGGWLPRSKYRLRDEPAFEQYLNSPRDTKPEDLLTLIYVPLGA